MIQFDEHIFQMGWFNHQPENHVFWNEDFELKGKTNKKETLLKIHPFFLRLFLEP